MFRFLIGALVMGVMVLAFSGKLDDVFNGGMEMLPDAVSERIPFYNAPHPLAEAIPIAPTIDTPDAMETQQGSTVSPEATEEPVMEEAVPEFDVISVYDGDTITVDHQGMPIRVRLAGIDAPESDQPGGPRAQNYLEACAGDDVVVAVIDIDQYGRQVAFVYSHDGAAESCNVSLVRAGLAYAYYNPTFEIMEAEAQAREAGRGVWADPEAIVPSDWRRQQRSE